MYLNKMLFLFILTSRQSFYSFTTIKCHKTTFCLWPVVSCRPTKQRKMSLFHTETSEAKRRPPEPRHPRVSLWRSLVSPKNCVGLSFFSNMVQRNVWVPTVWRHSALNLDWRLLKDFSYKYRKGWCRVIRENFTNGSSQSSSGSHMWCLRDSLRLYGVFLCI